jgi:hypothetical protein
MFISEIFATKNCAKTKEIRSPQKTKKRKEKTNPHPSPRIHFQSLHNKHG